MSRLAAVLVLALPGCALVRPSLELHSCKLDGVAEPLLCGTLPVREDRSDPTSRKLGLNIVVVPAKGEKTLPPLYDLAGGPGLAATESAGFWTTDGSIHREHRDIVLVDQRGSGGSRPLDCPLAFHDPLQQVLALGAVSDCRARLSAVADLSQYTTAAAVADLDDVRAALRHERIDLSALSYGTRVAQEYVRAHPRRVRAMALLGTLSPREKLPLSFSTNAQAVLDRLGEQCAADKRCHQAVADMPGDIAAIQKALATGGVFVTLKNGHKAPLQSGPFWEAVRKQLSTSSGQRRLPWLLHRAAYGEFEPILKAMATTPEQGADGLLLSVSCAEDTLRIAPEEIAALSRSVFGAYRTQMQIAACKVWNVPVLDDPRPGFVSGDLPVLFMAGDMDALTPVDWAQKVASHFPNSRVVVIPNLGHFPEGLSHLDCYDRIIAAFFEAGSAKDLEVSCVDTMQPLPFDVPEVKVAAKSRPKAQVQKAKPKKKQARKPAKKNRKKHRLHP